VPIGHRRLHGPEEFLERRISIGEMAIGLILCGHADEKGPIDMIAGRNDSPKLNAESPALQRVDEHRIPSAIGCKG
jgi:hypothetical protein